MFGADAHPAAAAHPVPPNDPLALRAEDLQLDLTINTTSALAAAQQTVAGFAQLPADANKVFIYTGNFLNVKPMPPLVSLGIGKAASAHLIQVASAAYAEKGWR